MGRHNKVTCRKCLRVIRSDNLKTHIKQHEKGNYEKESFCSSSIGFSIAHLQESENDLSSISTYSSTPINEEGVIKKL